MVQREAQSTPAGERSLGTDPLRAVKRKGAKGVLPQNFPEARRDIDGPNLGDKLAYVQNFTEKTKHGHRPTVREARGFPGTNGHQDCVSHQERAEVGQGLVGQDWVRVYPPWGSTEAGDVEIPTQNSPLIR